MVIDAFQSMRRDDEVSRALASGTIEWDAGVAPRLTQRLNDAAQARTKALQERFDRDLQHAQGSPAAVTHALLSLRGGLARTAVLLGSAKGLPQEVTAALVKYVRDSADAMQSSLVDSARDDRTGRVRVILRDTPVNKF